MTDILTLFNQLTHDELADYTKFENVLDNHYEKFKYFYRLMGVVGLDNIQKVRCSDTDDSNTLCIEIEFENKKHLKEFEKSFDDVVKTYKHYYKKYFKVVVESNKTTILISIINKKISKEGEIYEDRFDE